MSHLTRSTPANDVQALTASTCYLHPDRETGLRCIQCERSICVKCTVLVAVGQVCQACARTRRPVNYQVSLGVLLLAASVTVILSLLICTLALGVIAPLPVYVLYLLVPTSYPIARLLVYVLDRLTRAKRGRLFQVVVGISVGTGALPALFLAVVLATAIDMLLVGLFAIALAVAMMRHLR